MSQTTEQRAGKAVTVVGRALTREERLEAALAELQAREAARDPKFKPVIDLRKPKSTPAP